MHEYAQITGSILIRLYGCYEESRVMHTLIIHHHPPCRFSKRLSEQAWISPKHSDSYWKPRTFGKKNMQKTSIRLHPMIINHPLRMIFPTFRLWGLQLSCGSGLRQKGLPKPLRWPWPGDEPTWSNMENVWTCHLIHILMMDIDGYWWILMDDIAPWKTVQSESERHCCSHFFDLFCLATWWCLVLHRLIPSELCNWHLLLVCGKPANSECQKWRHIWCGAWGKQESCW